MTDELDELLHTITLQVNEYGQAFKMPSNWKLIQGPQTDILRRFITAGWYATVAEQLLFKEKKTIWGTIDVQRHWWQIWKPRKYRGTISLERTSWGSYPYLALPENKFGKVHFYANYKQVEND